MSDGVGQRSVNLSEGWVPPEIDTSVAHPARMYDYYLGGKDNYPVDREAAEKFLAILPGGPELPRVNRAFLGRAVRHLAAAGIRQFLDIGTGIPSPGNTSEVAHSVAPDCRIVCVDNDPIVLAHSRALLAERGAGRTTVVRGDLRQPRAILDDPDVRDVLDFSRPIGLLLVAVLHFVGDSDDPVGIVDELMRELAPGSHLVVSHITGDFNAKGAAAAAKVYERATVPLIIRDHKEIAGFFDKLELLEPGVVQIPMWRPDGELPPGSEQMWGYAGVGRKD